MRSEATNEIDENLYYVKNNISPYLDGQGRVAAGVKYAILYYSNILVTAAPPVH